MRIEPLTYDSTLLLSLLRLLDIGYNFTNWIGLKRTDVYIHFYNNISSDFNSCVLDA